MEKEKASRSSCSWFWEGVGGLFNYWFGYSQPNPEKQKLLISELKELVELSKKTLNEQNDIYERLTILENEAISHYEALTTYQKPKHPFFEVKESSPPAQSQIEPEKFIDLRTLLGERPKFDRTQTNNLEYIRTFSDELVEHHERVKELASICFGELYQLNERAASVRDRLNKVVGNTLC